LKICDNGLWDSECRLEGLCFKVWGLEFRVWGLRFEVWSLGFGVWGLELWVGFGF
jgi:hypothetical protein